MSKETPAYIRGAECQIVRAAVNLWLWASVIENKIPTLSPIDMESDCLPGPATFFVYPRDMELGGPQIMNGKRVKVTFEIESEASTR